nr:TIM barrel protein [Clostridia bacterium]
MFTYTMSYGWFPGTMAEKFAAMKAQGFKAVEILSWSGLDLEAASKAIDESGIEISAILIQSRDPEKQKYIANTHGMVWEDTLPVFLDCLKETIEAAKAMRTKTIVVTSGNERDDVSREVQHANIVKLLKAAAPIAEEAGMKLVLEPLNILVNHMGYYLTTTAESAEIINEVGSPNVRILYDVYHQQITEGNLINNIKNNIDLIGHIHVGDVPGRKQPGTGEINYKNVFKAIKETGYDGYVVFECGLTEPVEVACPKMWALLED